MQMNVLTHNHWLQPLCFKQRIESACGDFIQRLSVLERRGSGKIRRCSGCFTKSILPKYRSIVAKCTDLSGMVQSQAFCKYTGLAPSHLIEGNNSCIYKALNIIDVCDIKFVNLKKFYDDLNLDYGYHIYIEKCRYFEITRPWKKRFQLSSGICVGYY